MEQWFNTAIGRQMNPDNAYGLQCKDVVDDYCDALWGPNAWIYTVKPGDAKNVFSNASDQYFIKIVQDWNNPNLFPQHGDIIVYDGCVAVPEGHVAVVDNADNNSITVIQQDGYTQVPAFKSVLGYVLGDGARCIGWLRPKVGENMETVPAKSNLSTARQIAYALLGRDGRGGRKNAMAGESDDDLVKYHANADLTVAYINGVFDSQEGQSYRKAIDQVYADSVKSQQTAQAAQSASKTVQSKLDDANKQINDLKAQIASQTADTTNLNAFGAGLKWLIARLGLK